MIQSFVRGCLRSSAIDIVTFPDLTDLQRIHTHTAAGTDAQHMTGAGAEHRFHHRAELLQLIQRHKILGGAAKAAAMDTPGTAAIQHTLRQRQRQTHSGDIQRRNARRRSPAA